MKHNYKHIEEIYQCYALGKSGFLVEGFVD